MSGYWLGVATPFAIVLGILLLWLAGSLFAAAVSWAWKQAHYGLLKKGLNRRGLRRGLKGMDHPPRRGTPGGRVDPVRRILDVPVLRLDDFHRSRPQAGRQGAWQDGLTAGAFPGAG